MSRRPRAEDTRERLPVMPLAAGSDWLRVTSTCHDAPLYFDRQPGSRFNAHSQRFGTLYCARTVVGVLAESICRNAAELEPHLRIVPSAYLANQGLYRLSIKEPLTVANFTAPQLARYGLDARIFAEYQGGPQPYEFGPHWADHLFDAGLDGILYPSRHHLLSPCLALFEHPERTIEYQLLSTLIHSDEVLHALLEVFDWGIM